MTTIYFVSKTDPTGSARISGPDNAQIIEAAARFEQSSINFRVATHKEWLTAKRKMRESRKTDVA